jgi:hypothetical protein
MSPAEREARQMIADKKEQEARDKAYGQSLRMTEEAPMPKPAASAPKRMAKGGSVGSASKRADGCAQRGKTRGKMV